MGREATGRLVMRGFGHLGKSLSLGLAIAGLCSAARADTPLAFTASVGGPAECREVLAEFDWLCPEFETLDWIVIYGKPFWMRGELQVIRHDLDGDGRDDLIVRVLHTGHCGSAGCANRFYFGGPPPPENFHPFSVTSLAEPRLVERNGGRGIVFGETGRFFPIYKFKTMTEIHPRPARGN